MPNNTDNYAKNDGDTDDEPTKPNGQRPPPADGVKHNPAHRGTAHHDEMRQGGCSPNPNDRGHGDGHH